MESFQFHPEQLAAMLDREVLAHQKSVSYKVCLDIFDPDSLALMNWMPLASIMADP